MANNRFEKVKITGYSKKTFFSGGIEYRNFSPDLVGLQLTTTPDNIPLFTLGNFNITTNFSPKKTKIFKTKSFSNFVSLTDMDLTLEKAKTLLSDNAGVFLNLDKRNLSNYALFGSLREFIRVSLENIIINWPAALYINPEYTLPPLYETVSGFTVQNYSYDNVNNESTFTVNTNNITNNFLINYLESSVYDNTFSAQNKLRNLTINYKSYSVLYQGVEYDIINFTPARRQLNDSISLKVKGNPFPNTVNGYQIFHIKPNKIEENSFYNNLELFEAYLLNRQSNPIFTAEFNLTIKTDNGGILFRNENVTWPTRDGYNIDFTSDDYDEYSTKLLELSDNSDLTSSNLMVRFLVAESITSFDTSAIVVDPQNNDNTDQKMNKTLTIFGRSFDDLNQYINGVKFANTVTYNKENNTPDVYLKNIARVLGWDLLSSVLENNLLKTYIEPSDSTYEGQAVGLTAIEADIELWRRIILNSPWLWKSKGTRKAIEFLFKFIGAPLGLITFNEYVYLSENKIDLDLFYEILLENNLNTDLSVYPINDNGYPKPLPDRPDLYFQSDGLWYRETGGDNSNIDITSGNNPHVGPYDGGGKYIEQFRSLIPNFSATTLSSETITNDVKNIFSNYSLGSMNFFNGPLYVDVLNENNTDIGNCYVVNNYLIDDPKKRKAETDCGCKIPDVLNSLSVCISSTTTPTLSVFDCDSNIKKSETKLVNDLYVFSQKLEKPDGTPFTINGIEQYYNSPFIASGCCNTNFVGANGAELLYFDEFTDVFKVMTGGKDKGFICCKTNNRCDCYLTCKWGLYNPLDLTASIYIKDNKYYLTFLDESENQRLVSNKGCNCLETYTKPTWIMDPYTKKFGYACELTEEGLIEFNEPAGTITPIQQHYMLKYFEAIPCIDNTTTTN